MLPIMPPDSYPPAERWRCMVCASSKGASEELLSLSFDTSSTLPAPQACLPCPPLRSLRPPGCPEVDAGFNSEFECKFKSEFNPRSSSDKASMASEGTHCAPNGERPSCWQAAAASMPLKER